LDYFVPGINKRVAVVLARSSLSLELMVATSFEIDGNDYTAIYRKIGLKKEFVVNLKINNELIGEYHRIQDDQFNALPFEKFQCIKFLIEFVKFIHNENNLFVFISANSSEDLTIPPYSITNIDNLYDNSYPISNMMITSFYIDGSWYIGVMRKNNKYATTAIFYKKGEEKIAEYNDLKFKISNFDNCIKDFIKNHTTKEFE